jgi:hypothetical protein
MDDITTQLSDHSPLCPQVATPSPETTIPATAGQSTTTVDTSAIPDAGSSSPVHSQDTMHKTSTSDLTPVYVETVIVGPSTTTEEAPSRSAPEPITPTFENSTITLTIQYLPCPENCQPEQRSVNIGIRYNDEYPMIERISASKITPLPPAIEELLTLIKQEIPRRNALHADKKRIEEEKAAKAKAKADEEAKQRRAESAKKAADTRKRKNGNLPAKNASTSNTVIVSTRVASGTRPATTAAVTSIIPPQNNTNVTAETTNSVQASLF